jgi:hypothetical protein
MIALATVKPPTPESKIPIGAELDAWLTRITLLDLQILTKCQRRSQN